MVTTLHPSANPQMLSVIFLGSDHFWVTTQPFAQYLNYSLPFLYLHFRAPLSHHHGATMQASAPDIVMQFTEDTFAREDRVCQWSRCQAPIRKGDPCRYVAAYDPAQPGKFVCGACYRWYKNKPATTVRAQNMNGVCPNLIYKTQINISSVLPDPQSIRQCISAAQSKGMFISMLL